MKFRVKTLIIIATFTILLSVCIFTSVYYCKNFSKSSYYNSNRILKFEELFYEPKSKECEIYSIGDFGCIDLDILEEYPDEIDYYNKYSYKIYNEDTIKYLINLLRKCRFSPVERNKAFLISISHKNSNTVASLSLSRNWFDDEYNRLFSEKIVDEINEQCFGISRSSLFIHKEKLYLLGLCPTRIIANGYLKYEQPDFSKTVTILCEVEMSDAAKEIIDNKDIFCPYPERIWKLTIR